MRGSLSTRLILWTTLLGWLLLAVPYAMAETRTLDKDTGLHPQGWTVGDRVTFRKNTVVQLNTQGEVVSGTLAEDTFLRPRGWERVINDYYYVTAYTDNGLHFRRHFRFFEDGRYNMAIPGYGHLLYKGGTAVRFSEQGDVVTGTIAENASIRLGEGKYGFITFAKNNVLAFYQTGAVMSGVLAEDTALRPWGWTNIPVQEDARDAAGFIKFKAKKTVLFTEKGELLSGTLKEAVKLFASNGNVTTIPANSTVTFNELGVASVEK